MKRNIESVSMYLNIFLFLILANSLLSRFAVVNFTSSPATGVSNMYIAVAFMIVFALWYGLGGALAAYLGCIVGAGILADMPTSLNIIWSLADLWQVLIPLVAFTYFKVNLRLKTRRDVAYFLVFAVFLNNIIGASWGTYMLMINGIIPYEELFLTFERWFTGNVIATILIVPFLLRYLTPYIQQTESYVENYWK
ncbi:hypothetical protein LI82_04985 [Methanococcoides methylutens]|uniref:MASE1 domain-containing protein n=1 Tax=Methanococcoides methylutens TaxID=2226 RepID=A0A099T2L5_METMT|nr:hypothetical protein [Methanococcoides methylutens]KGK99362.1 hypothetical protein LI82_04985 [Methanococcoides methylutens]